MGLWLNSVQCTSYAINAFLLNFFCSVRTELVGEGAISRLSITQANTKHSGIYTCSVSDTISQSLRLHILDGKVF